MAGLLRVEFEEFSNPQRWFLEWFTMGSMLCLATPHQSSDTNCSVLLLLTLGCWDEGFAADRVACFWMFQAGMAGLWQFRVTEIILTAALLRGHGVTIKGVGSRFLRALGTHRGAVVVAAQVIQTLTWLGAELGSWGTNMLLITSPRLHQPLHLQRYPVTPSTLIKSL